MLRPERGSYGTLYRAEILSNQGLIGEGAIVGRGIFPPHRRQGAKSMGRKVLSGERMGRITQVAVVESDGRRG